MTADPYFDAWVDAVMDRKAAEFAAELEQLELPADLAHLPPLDVEQPR